MKRYIYDKSCYQAINGQIGRLQTVFNIPVLANDTLSINLVGNFKLSKLRRWLALDANIHIALYYVKHRWCYDGSGATTTWEDFIKSSLSDERVSASTLETITIPDNSWTEESDLYGATFTGNDVIPAHLVKGYNKIWNRWYRIPAITDAVADDYVPTWGSGSNNPPKYGYEVARLPNFWNTGIPGTNLDADSTIIETGGADSMTLLDIAQIQAEYQDDLDRDWFASRYRDLLSSKWGSNGITPEIDENEAELLLDTTIWASGSDIHGTDQSTLGDYVGKTQQMISLRMPPRYFNEHGMVWCVMCVRFPSICTEEAHYTSLNTLTAKNFLGYPEVARSEPPVNIAENDCFSLSSETDSFGKVPYYNWYRFNPNRITNDFSNYDTVKGFPFLSHSDIDVSTDGHSSLAYETSTNGFWDTSIADRFFANTELQHWNMISKAEIECRSVLPPASESIYAGARHIN